MYLHEHQDWPKFQWNQAALAGLLADARHLQGRLLGRMEAVGFQLRDEATLQTLTLDVVKSCAIEGERLDAVQVRSSLARRMGLDSGAVSPMDRNVEGIVEVMLDATRKHDDPLTPERLFGWHAALFPTGRSGMRRITVGAWRTKQSGAMQVVSGPIGRERVHYEAPGYERLDAEMSRFLEWFDGPPGPDPVIKAALAHFWFVTIHPFEDGNGRIARAISDMMLARSEKTPRRFYSMSTQIERERAAYYDVLEQCQKGTPDLTIWIEWFLNCLKRAIAASEQTLQTVLAKADFWRARSGEAFNERQRKVIDRLLDGFEGKLTSSKWAKLTKCSQDTALRDINDLVERQVLGRDEAGGRSTSYTLFRNDPPGPAKGESRQE